MTEAIIKYFIILFMCIAFSGCAGMHNGGYRIENGDTGALPPNSHSGRTLYNKWELSGAGVSLFSSGVKKDFKQYELYGTRELAPIWNSVLGISLKAELNAHAGIINVQDETAFFCSIGPGAVLSIHDNRIFSSFGINPTILTKKDFYDIHMGGPLQFTVYAEIDANITGTAGIGFRTQHTSNANIYKENHGFNTYMLLLNYYFSGDK